jgi:hypothetical protein
LFYVSGLQQLGNDLFVQRLAVLCLTDRIERKDIIYRELGIGRERILNGIDELGESGVLES